MTKSFSAILTPKGAQTQDTPGIRTAPSQISQEYATPQGMSLDSCRILKGLSSLSKPKSGRENGQLQKQKQKQKQKRKRKQEREQKRKYMESVSGYLSVFLSMFAAVTSSPHRKGHPMRGGSCFVEATCPTTTA